MNDRVPHVLYYKKESICAGCRKLSWYLQEIEKCRKESEATKLYQNAVNEM